MPPRVAAEFCARGAARGRHRLDAVGPRSCHRPAHALRVLLDKLVTAGWPRSVDCKSANSFG
ncbi:MAG: hypothetical protein DWI64_04600 [Chloroflexi bacterium]|nr:MAG: hypothetical protein DWI64_04600 [Chloroflexota bacterium]